jgi:hypothetical protein
MQPKGSCTTLHNIFSHASSGLLDNGEASGGFMIDTSLDEVQAFMTAHVPGSHMPAQCWHKISAAVQVTWDELSDSDKAATILGADTGLSGHPAPHGHGSHFPSHVTHAAQLHNLDHDALAAFMHDIQIDDAPDSLVPPMDDNVGATPADMHVTFDDDAATSTELLAHATKHTWMRPKVDALPPSDLWKRMVDHPTAKGKPELTINGTTYIAKSHCVYDVSSAHVLLMVHLLIMVLMLVLLVMTSVSLRHLDALSMFVVSMIIC